MSILTQTNLNYERYDVDNVLASPQPAFRSDTMDSAGWTNFEFNDYDGDFVPHLVGNGVTETQPYVKRDIDNNPVTQPQYIRHDIDNNSAGSLDPLESEGVGNISALDGYVVGRTVSGQVAGYKGGTEPIIIEGQLQKQDTPGGAWVGISPWVAVDSKAKTIEPSMIGGSLRLSTRIQDAVTAPSYIIVHTNGGDAVVDELKVATHGTVTATGNEPGDTLTQTAGTFTGGVAPFVTKVTWLKSLTGEGGTYHVIDGDNMGLTYVLREDDRGYFVKGRTRTVDAFGYVKVSLPYIDDVVGNVNIEVPPILPFEVVSPGTVTIGGAGTGDQLTQTAATYTEGRTPYTIQLRWLKRLTGTTNPFETFATGSTYTIRGTDQGYDIVAQTKATDADGTVLLTIGLINGDPDDKIFPVGLPLTVLSKGNLTGEGKSGTTLTQTQAQFYGGVPPYTYSYQWVRRETGGSGFFDFGAPEQTTYDIQVSDIGYDIRGRTVVTDSVGSTTNSSATIPGDVSVTE